MRGQGCPGTWQLTSQPLLYSSGFASAQIVHSRVAVEARPKRSCRAKFASLPLQASSLVAVLTFATVTVQSRLLLSFIRSSAVLHSNFNSRYPLSGRTRSSYPTGACAQTVQARLPDSNLLALQVLSWASDCLFTPSLAMVVSGVDFGEACLVYTCFPDATFYLTGLVAF